MNFDHNTQDFMRMQQNYSFQECVEKNIYQKIYLFLNNLIDKGAKVPYNYDVNKRIRRQDPSFKE